MFFEYAMLQQHFQLDSNCDTQMNFDSFYDYTFGLLNQFYPEREITMTSTDPHYVTPAVKAMLRRKNRLMRAFPFPAPWTTVTSYVEYTEYLANDLRRVADLGMRRRLRSASTHALVVPPSRLSTVADRAFPAAAARVWNSLPDFVTASTSLPMFKRHLKTVLFAKSY